MPKGRVTVYDKVLKQDLNYKETVLLSYTVKYPYFILDNYQSTLDKINYYYQTEAYTYVRTYINRLYQQAMVEYEYAMANNFPVRPFEVVTVYNVTYNKNCALSLYFDRYEYTGGAHGITRRSSDTWNIAKSTLIGLKDLFLIPNDIYSFVTDSIVEQIDHIKSSEGEDFPYFEDYEALVKDNFKYKSFYLNNKGLVIYYQLYEIAPYASGLPEFLLPYGMGGPIRPRFC